MCRRTGIDRAPRPACSGLFWWIRLRNCSGCRGGRCITGFVKASCGRSGRRAGRSECCWNRLRRCCGRRWSVGRPAQGRVRRPVLGRAGRRPQFRVGRPFQGRLLQPQSPALRVQALARNSKSLSESAVPSRVLTVVRSRSLFPREPYGRMNCASKAGTSAAGSPRLGALRNDQKTDRQNAWGGLSGNQHACILFCTILARSLGRVRDRRRCPGTDFP